MNDLMGFLLVVLFSIFISLTISISASSEKQIVILKEINEKLEKKNERCK